MKIKVKDLVQAVPAISHLINQDVDFKTGYLLARFANKIQPELTLIRKTQEPMTPDEQKEFVETEIEIDVQKLPFSMFEKVQLTGLEIMNLLLFINEEEK